MVLASTLFPLSFLFNLFDSQNCRQALVEAGLKRAEIGEISSKIGQLNYTFYQRCADTR
jgi:hypothetical protein